MSAGAMGIECLPRCWQVGAKWDMLV